MKELHRLPVAAGGERWGQPNLRNVGEVGAAPTTPGRSGTARRCGSGNRDRKGYVRNQRFKASSVECTGSNLVDMGRGVTHAFPRRRGDSRTGYVASAGRPWGKTAAYPWRGHGGRAGSRPCRTVRGERGNHLVPSLRRPTGRWWVDALPVDGTSWGGAGVVVRGGESPPHGEGRQRERGGSAATSGERR
jgi:hypothetical protein